MTVAVGGAKGSTFGVMQSTERSTPPFASKLPLVGSGMVAVALTVKLSPPIVISGFGRHGTASDLAALRQLLNTSGPSNINTSVAVQLVESMTVSANKDD